MKYRQYRYGCILLFFSLILISCTKTEILPDLKGNMAGYVYTFGEFAESGIPDDKSGVTVIVLGTKEYTTTSDKNGRFEFSKLPAGTYELQFQKNGYGTLKQFGIKHLGGEPTVLNSAFDHSSYGSAFVLHALPTTAITELKIEKDSLFCGITFQGVMPEALYIQLFLSRTENFDSKSADYIFTNFRLEAKEGKYSSQFGSFILQRLPFNKGEKVFFRACVSPYYGQTVTISDFWHLIGIDTYFDYENNEVVYPALGKVSGHYSFIFP
jgi:hypothetical protein